MLSACLVLAIAAAPSPNEVPAGERGILSVAVAAPTGRMFVTSRTEILEAIAEAAQEMTNLESQELERSATCLARTAGGDRLRCLALAARTEAGETAAPYVLVVSVLPAKGEDRISAVLIDAARANEIIEKTPEAEQSSVDVAILESAILMSAPQASARDASEVDHIVRKLFERNMQSVLRRFGHWGPLGVIEIHADRDGLEITLDGKTLPGLTSRGVTRVVEVHEGQRAVALGGKDVVPVSTTLRVEHGVISQWNPELKEVVHAPNALVFWTGVGVAAAGVGLTVVGALTPNPGGLHVPPDGDGRSLR